MLTRNEFIQDAERVFDKVYGAMSGLAIGDSFGDASRKPENRANYSVTTDFNKGASWSTDDTEFALLTAKTIIRCGGKLTTEECVRSWMEDVVTQDEYKRGGASEIEAANNLRKGLMPPLSGKYNSFRLSDGSSMRIGPIGIICAGDPEKAKEYARIEAEVSHYEDGVWGAQAVAAAVAVAMVDGSMEEIIEAAMSAIPGIPGSTTVCLRPLRCWSTAAAISWKFGWICMISCGPVPGRPQRRRSRRPLYV